MFVWGKVIGAILGFIAFKGVFGLVIGLLIGHFFDRSAGQVIHGNGASTGDDHGALKQLFMELLFTSLGHIAKADGRISEAEIQQTEHIIKDLALGGKEREQAIRWFKQGAKADNDYEDLLGLFARETRLKPQLKQVLLEMLISLALVDGKIHQNEENILMHIAQRLGVPKLAFQQLLKLLKAQQSFQQAKPSSPTDQLSAAYQALGVSPSATDPEVKKAYRKLMSEHHPDKLIAQGVPEDVIKLATEKSQAIQAAYDLIKTARKG